MIRSIASAAGLLFSSVVLAASVAPDASIPPVPGNLRVPGAFMVQFHDDHEHQDEDGFISQLETEVGVSGVEKRLRLKSSVFNGMSFRLGSDNNSDLTADKIATLPQVKQIWPVNLYPAPKLSLSWTAKDMTTSELQRRAVQDTFSPHVMTQVDKMRAEGYTGQGLRIGVVDSGVDYTHPALGGCFGPGCLVEYGTDFVGDTYDGTNAPTPDDDPLDQCMGHGTHVTGIIAAQENPLNFTGAAPDVKIGMYRVFGCNGGSAGDIILAGIIQAYEDGSDIITGSLGVASGWKEDPVSLAVSQIVAAGVPCTFAAGNEVGGTEGLFGVSSPSTGSGVISVASFENSETNPLGGGYVNDFSSWGPTFDLEVKPQFGAPGGDILSTLPVTMGSYGVESGTSMATPLMAAIVALIAQARGTRDPLLIGKLLSSTARPGPSSSGSLAPVPQQGAGLVQAYNAAHATSLFSISSLSLNDTEHFVSETSFTVTNLADTATTYDFYHLPAPAADTLYLIYRDSEPVLHEAYATLEFVPSTITVEPNGTVEIGVHATLPEGLDPTVLPIYSGWIKANATSGAGDSSLTVPYVGAAAAMRNVTVLASERIWLTRSDDPFGPVLADGTVFQLAAPPAHPEWARPLWNVTDLVLPLGALPTQFFWLVMGSAETRLEVVPLAPSCSGPKPNPTDNGLGVQTLGNIPGYPATYHFSIGWTDVWDGSLADGTWAPPGRYRLSIFALKIFGDRANPSDWDRFDSSVFLLRYV
ncbi:subtilase [Thozetella sp. PMI_491]|nr:subtilase [Thozetella sp. PMI_491]